MKVSKLVRELKKMPQNAEVHVSAHDNAEWETQGIVWSVRHYEKKEFKDDIDRLSAEDDRMFKTMPKQWVALHC